MGQVGMTHGPLFNCTDSVVFKIEDTNLERQTFNLYGLGPRVLALEASAPKAMKSAPSAFEQSLLFLALLCKLDSIGVMV